MTSPIITINSPYQISYEIEHNQILTFPIELTTMKRIQINAIHAAPTQDFSLLCWFSTQPNTPVIFYDNCKYHVNLQKKLGSFFVIQDVNIDQMPAAYVMTHKLEPGTYYFNVYNIVNAKNTFGFSIRETQF